MQRDRGRSSTDRREAAILRAWRVGNSLAAMRAGKRHAGRTHKSRHMQNEARCISCNSPNELLPRVAYKVHTWRHCLICVRSTTRDVAHGVRTKRRCRGVICRVSPGFVYFVKSRFRECALPFLPGTMVPFLDPCAFFDAPTLPISGILVATRSLVYLWQPDSNAFQQKASRSAQRLRGTCCWGAQGAARDPPPSHSSRTIRSSTFDAIRFIRVARRSPTGV